MPYKGHGVTFLGGDAIREYQPRSKDVSWYIAFIDCLFEKRGYSHIPNLHKALPMPYRRPYDYDAFNGDDSRRERMALPSSRKRVLMLGDIEIDLSDDAPLERQ